MDTKTKLRKPASPAPRGLRTMLVCLLILSAVSGYAVNAYLFFRAGADLQSGLNIPFADLSGQKFSGDFSRPDTTPSDRPPRTDGNRLERVQTLLQKTAGMNSGAISLTFNGSMTGKNGTLAMINKKAVP